MPYFRWRAYNSKGQEFNGVEEASRFELVVIYLASKGLTAANVESIGWEEFQSSRIANTKLSKLHKIKQSLSTSGQIPELAMLEAAMTKSRRSKSILIFALLIVVVLALLCYAISNLHNLW